MNARHNFDNRQGGLLARTRPDLAALLPQRPASKPERIIDDRPAWIKRLAANAKVLV